VEGRVKLFKLSADGRERVVHVFGPGESFAEAAIFGDRRFPVNAQAMAPTELFFLPRDPLLRLFREDPELSLGILASMAIRLKGVVSRLETLTLQSAAGRLAHFLLINADPGGKVRLRQPKKELAAHLGMAPETLSRLLAQLREAGALEVRGRTLVIADRRRIDEVATGRRYPPVTPEEASGRVGRGTAER